MSRLAAGAAGGGLVLVALLAYPVLVYFLLDPLGAGWLGVALIGLLVLRAGLAAPRAARFAALAAAGAAYLALLAAADRELILKLYPALASLAMLAAFAWTLRRPPSMVERLARRFGMDVSPQGITYMRALTRLWCVFFALNAAVSVAVTLGGSLRAWAFYNGFLSYLLSGALFAGEYLYRQSYRRRVHQGGA